MRTGQRDTLDRVPPATWGALAVAAAAGAVVFWTARTLFPYHSANHDEGVYLLQAAMLLDGRLRIDAGGLAGAFRPWFFVREGSLLYPKYAPVPAAIFASGEAVGEPRLALAAVAAGNAYLCYALAAAAFDRRTGLLTSVALVASPLFLFSSSVFLPYAPTTLLNLLFAVAYVRAARRRHRGYSVLAGAAIGLAFFARPYTAVLFAVPFVVHAAWRTSLSIRRDGPRTEPVRRHGATAAIGLAFVGLTLAYNAALTGSALTFPYEAFAPRDGLGFGRRRILDHSVVYTPELALRANAHVVWYFLTRWSVAGPIGSALALVGLASALRRVPGRGSGGLGDRTLRLLLAGVAASVIVGNVYFWGNYNVLATIDDPTDGMVSLLGPFYHFDLLVPAAAFAAHGALVVRDRVCAALARFNPARARALGLAALVVSLLPLAAVTAATVAAPAERNAAYAEKYERTYAPIDDREFERALVFLPTPYGDWLQHPFQYLRNDPGLDGEVVYALDRDPSGDFAVVDAYPDRTYYRFTYRGEWTPGPSRRVIPRLERLSVREGRALAGRTTVGAPAGSERATVRVESDAGAATRELTADLHGTLALEWRLESDEFRIEGGPDEPLRVPIDGAEEVVVRVTFVQPGGATVTYEQRLTVEARDDGVRLLWPPERRVCRLVIDCGTEGTYLPDRPEAHLEGVSFETDLASVEALVDADP